MAGPIEHEGRLPARDQRDLTEYGSGACRLDDQMSGGRPCQGDQVLAADIHRLPSELARQLQPGKLLVGDQNRPVEPFDFPQVLEKEKPSRASAEYHYLPNSISPLKGVTRTGF